MDAETILLAVLGAGVLALAVSTYLPKHFRSRPPADAAAVGGSPSNDRRFMAIGVSVAVGGAALYMILSKHYTGESEKWAFGAVGTVVGFWLRPERE